MTANRCRENPVEAVAVAAVELASGDGYAVKLDKDVVVVATITVATRPSLSLELDAGTTNSAYTAGLDLGVVR